MSISAKNKAATDRAIKALEKAVANLENNIFPGAMEDVGETVVDYMKATHTFQNRTGRLEKSYAYVVVPPGSTENFEFEFEGRKSEMVTSSPNVLELIFGAGAPYARYVEGLYGFDVAINGFLFLRRQFVRLFGEKVRSKKLF